MLTEVAAAVLTIGPGAQGAGPPAPNYAGCFPPSARVELSSAWARGRASYAVSEKQVRFSWSWTTSGPRPRQFSAQEEGVPFWPTAVVSVAPDVIAVAGREGACTVIELWELRAPLVPPQPMPDAEGACTYPELVIPVAAKTTLLHEAAAGRDLVYLALPNPAPPANVVHSLFVQFFDSKNLYRLDVDDAGRSTLNLVAAPVSQGGLPKVPIFPPLSNAYEFCWSADHPRYGHVYVFAMSPNSNKPRHDTFVIFDEDRDGNLREGDYLSLDGPTWCSQGWGDVATYSRLF